MNFEDLTPEQKEKARTCKTPEDLLALAKEYDYVLSDEELNSISGGSKWGGGPYDHYCPVNSCQSYNCYGFYCEQVSCTALTCEHYDHD